LNEDRKLIAKYLGCNHELLKSWIHGLCNLRNYCAHYSRIWDRKFSQRIKPAHGYETWITDSSLIASYFSVIAYLLATLGRKDDFLLELKALFTEYKKIPLSSIGLSEKWMDF
jgi:abortive infection bacteriophage resistance protein